MHSVILISNGRMPILNHAIYIYTFKSGAQD